MMNEDRESLEQPDDKINSETLDNDDNCKCAFVCYFLFVINIYLVVDQKSPSAVDFFDINELAEEDSKVR